MIILGFSDRFSFQFDFEAAVQQAIQDGVGDGRFTDDGMPVFDRALTGDHGGSLVVTILDDFEQIIASAYS